MVFELLRRFEQTFAGREPQEDAAETCVALILISQPTQKDPKIHISLGKATARP
jgi:hypothetical protein